MDNRPVKLNDLSRAQIAQLIAEAEERKASKRAVRHCIYCGKESTMRPDQKFCSSSCRVKAHKMEAELAYNQLLQERQTWLSERDELIKENASLRAKLKAAGVAA